MALLTALVEQVKREGESKAAEEVEALTKVWGGWMCAWEGATQRIRGMLGRGGKGA